jgi:hypothetical protein
MKYKGDIYLIDIGGGMTMISSKPSSSPVISKTIGVAKDVEIEFQKYDNSADVESRKADIDKKIAELEKEREGL